MSVSPSIGAEIPIYTTVCVQTSLSINGAFNAAWQIPVPSTGGCAHLATYRTQAEFTNLVKSMQDAGVAEAIIGARRQSDTNVYKWDAGQWRGSSFIEPVNVLHPQAINANCIQGFCLPSMNNAAPITSDAQTGMVLSLQDRNGNLDATTAIAHLIPSTGSRCYVYAYESVDYIPDVKGGPPFVFYPGLDTFDNHQTNAIMNSQFLARVENATQTQYIKDELQCGTFNIWLGYETGITTTDLAFSAGPGESTQILSGGSTTCTSPYYCNFPSGFLGITTTDSAISLASNTGYWSAVTQSSLRSALRQRENCTNPVDGTKSMCDLPSFTQNYYSPGTAASKYMTGMAFYAGGGYRIAGTLFYFDCSCATSQRVDLVCLNTPEGQADPSICIAPPA